MLFQLLSDQVREGRLSLAIGRHFRNFSRLEVRGFERLTKHWSHLGMAQKLKIHGTGLRWSQYWKQHDVTFRAPWGTPWLDKYHSYHSQFFCFAPHLCPWWCWGSRKRSQRCRHKCQRPADDGDCQSQSALNLRVGPRVTPACLMFWLCTTKYLSCTTELYWWSR